MYLDGNVDNAFPWMSSSTTTTASPHTASPHAASPHDNLPLLTPGIPPTPGWIPHTPGIPPTPGVSADPPRQAREGYEWVWFPDGYWAEREVSAGATESPSKGSGLDSKLRRWKGKSSKGSQGSVDLDVSPVPRRGSGSTRRGSGGSAGLFTPQPHTPFRTERELVQALQQSSDSEPFWGYPFTPVAPSGERGNDSGSSPASTVRGGFRRGSWPETQTIIEEIGKDETGSQGSATPLSRLKAIGRSKEKRKSRSSERGPLDESLSESSDGHKPTQQSNTRKLLSKLSWRKKESPADSDSLSLIEEEASFTMQSNHSFWDSVYPGGEARRITTPPLKEATADGRVRSLFTEVDNFDPDEARSEADNRSQMSGLNNGGGTSSESGTLSSSEGSKLNMAYRKAAAADANGGSNLHWFDSKKEEDEKKKQWVKEKKKNMKSRPGIFALTVPEHLPNSPLCPANPRHVSGGTGVCVFHGRKQDIAKSKQPFVVELGLQQPTTKS